VAFLIEMIVDRSMGGCEFLYGLGPFQRLQDLGVVNNPRHTASPSPTAVKIAARHTLIMFGVLMCEKDSPQIVKSLAVDSAVSQRKSICQSVGFKS
jgi:hypothetical protein